MTGHEKHIKTIESPAQVFSSIVSKLKKNSFLLKLLYIVDIKYYRIEVRNPQSITWRVFVPINVSVHIGHNDIIVMLMIKQ